MYFIKILSYIYISILTGLGIIIFYTMQDYLNMVASLTSFIIIISTLIKEI